MSLRRWFNEHPSSVGENYLLHADHAAGFGAAMLCGALASFLHALISALRTTTTSRIPDRLHDRMTLNRVRHRSTALQAQIPENVLAEHS